MVIAAFATWHEHHQHADLAIDARTRLVAHCALETYSVLTRLPPPHRSPQHLVRDFLAERFPDPYLVLDEAAHRALISRLPERGIVGGATYDALVGSTAVAAGATLVTLDGRAASTYRRCGVDIHLLV
ncbi:MAG: PIN domain-containing protein [Candidatus Dormibacteria bacterium]